MSSTPPSPHSPTFAAETPPSARPPVPARGIRRVSLTQWLIISLVVGVAVGALFP